MNTFIGVDLGWYGKPTGLASLALEVPERTGRGARVPLCASTEELRLRNVARLEDVDEILCWIQTEAGGGNAVVAVDAPLVIRNQTSIRLAERELNTDFRRFHAGCHAANLGRPFAEKVISFSRRLETLGFGHGAAMTPRQEGRFQIEVHPHAATVSLFGLDRIVKYKRGTREQRGRGLRRLRSFAMTHLPALSLSLSASFPEVPKTGNLKPTEDKIDAILCAYIAAHWWVWTTKRNRLYGNQESGYIVVPIPRQPTNRKTARPPSIGSVRVRASDLGGT